MTTLATVEQQVLGRWMLQRDTAPIVRGRGSWLWDSEDRRYLDLTSGYGTACLGHAHPALTRAISDQAAELIACPTFLASESRSLFLRTLTEILPDRLSRAVLVNSGTEAVEAGLKLARVATGRQGLVGLRGSFHGRTSGALAITWNPKTRRPFEPLLPGAVFPANNSLSALEEVIDDNTAVVVVEIIQGESGVNILDGDFLRGVEQLCRQRGALLMVDEIQTGCGRTGAWFAHTAVGLQPDLLALAKGLGGGFPIGALAYTENVGEALFPGAHGSTFGGGALACAAGRATLETLQAEALPSRAEDLGARLLGRLRQELEGRRIVREIRGRGLMIGVELRERVGRYVAALTREHQVLVLPAGQNVIRLLPPLNLEEDEAELAVRALAEVLP